MTSGSDGVALTASRHPVAPWYKRLWWRLRYGSKPRLNEQSLETMLIEIKKINKGKRIRLKPTQVIIPIGVVQDYADKMGVTLEEARVFLHERAEMLARSAKR